MKAPRYLIESGFYEHENEVGSFLIDPKTGRPVQSRFHGLTAELKGNVLTTKVVSKLPPSGGGKRGRVDSFSKQSRSRLIQTLNTIQCDPTLFVTLTYPREFDNAKSKYHLKSFADWFRYKYPHASFFWKLEYQQRGAAHYHLIIWGVRKPRTERGWRRLRFQFARRWYQIVDSRDERHLRAGIQLDPPEGPWRYYLAKYVSKVEQSYTELEHSGRIWGFHNRVALSFAPSLKGPIDPSLFETLRSFTDGLSVRCLNPCETEAIRSLLTQDTMWFNIDNQ